MHKNLNLQQLVLNNTGKDFKGITPDTKCDTNLNSKNSPPHRQQLMPQPTPFTYGSTTQDQLLLLSTDLAMMLAKQRSLQEDAKKVISNATTLLQDIAKTVNGILEPINDSGDFKDDSIRFNQK